MALDTRPMKVEVIHYAGDTLTIRVIAPAELTDGKQWKAVLKQATDTEVIDAEFDITVPQSSGGPAYLVLPGATTKALAAGQPVVMKVPQTARLSQQAGATPMAVQEYKGVWDCQLSVNGTDPIRTIVKGTLLIEMDVTP